MDWTLLVPGALFAPPIAPELARALRLPELAGQLALAGPLPRRTPMAAAHGEPASERQPPHWSWLALQFGLDPAALATAPYAWRAGSARDPSAPRPAPDDTVWVAHCTPVHLAIARDHFVVYDLADAPLHANESAELLELANAVLAGEARTSATAAAAGTLRLAQRGGQWFLLSPRPLDIQAWALDAVLGQSVQDRLPMGADARRWRVLSNEIQMSWHASASAAAREEAGARTANALWLHGGGTWRPLAPVPPMHLRAEGADNEAAVIHGWLDAGCTTGDAHPGEGADASNAAPAHTLAICRDLFGAHALQAWETWLERWPGVQARILAEMDRARQANASRFVLVLSGVRQWRSITVPLRPHWWQRLQRPPAHATLLERWLTETPLAPDTLHGTRARPATEPALSP